jgi:mannose-1-phosphate guanylyltransferase
MKIVIFAGGSGRRLWPISRQRSPKQFEPIIGDRSTVQLSVDRVRHVYGDQNIFVSTNERYLDILKHQLPDLPRENFICEPERRDLAAAVGLTMFQMERNFGPSEPVAIIWGDNYMTEEATFLQLLGSAEQIINNDKINMVFIGETARFPNNNLGWIGLGEVIGEVDGKQFFEFRSWRYRPELEECRRMFRSGRFVWNTGYFVTTCGYVVNAFKEHQPEMWHKLNKVSQAIGQNDYKETLYKVYPQLPVYSFDDAIVAKLPRDEAVVLHGTSGWSDPGTLYALKEAVNPDPSENVIKGLVSALNSQDCLLYNYEDSKLLAAAGLKGMIVVNTEDAILVVHKDDIRLVKQLVNKMVGTELEQYS